VWCGRSKVLEGTSASIINDLFYREEAAVPFRKWSLTNYTTPRARKQAPVQYLEEWCFDTQTLTRGVVFVTSHQRLCESRDGVQKSCVSWKISLSFIGTQMFITVSTRAHQWYLS
jgi:hypothetical protein